MVFYRNKNYPTRISQVGANNKHLQNFIKIGFRDWRERTSDFYTACAIYNFIFLVWTPGILRYAHGIIPVNSTCVGIYY
jgi:hypothetical protein